MPRKRKYVVGRNKGKRCLKKLRPRKKNKMINGKRYYNCDDCSSGTYDLDNDDLSYSWKIGGIEVSTSEKMSVNGKKKRKFLQNLLLV